jgi:ABC-type uncharacterized transport system ATPase subunit
VGTCVIEEQLSLCNFRIRPGRIRGTLVTNLSQCTCATFLVEEPILERDTVIQTSGLTKDYGLDRGLFDLDLEVTKGEIFCFLGPNGAGKTTAIKLLMGLIFPTAASANVLGMDAHA